MLRNITIKITLSTALLTCSPVFHADILFNAKVMGPVTNIYTANKEGNISKITQNNTWQDMDHSISTQKKLLFISNRHSQRKSQSQITQGSFDVYLMDLNGNEIKPLTQSQQNEISPSFSYDGLWIAYLKVYSSTHHQLIIRSANDLTFQKTIAEGNITGFAWARTSNNVAITTINNNVSALQILNIKSGLQQTVFNTRSKLQKSNNNDWLLSPVWSPNDKSIAYIKHPLNSKKKRSLHVVNLKSKKHIQVSPESIEVQTPVNWSAKGEKLLYCALVNYRYFYDEKTNNKKYQGGMHIFESQLHGKSKQLTQGDHLHTQAIYSPDNKSVAYLYADKLGDARTYTLRTMSLSTGKTNTLYSEVNRNSTLVWYQ